MSNFFSLPAPNLQMISVIKTIYRIIKVYPMIEPIQFLQNKGVDLATCIAYTRQYLPTTSMF